MWRPQVLELGKLGKLASVRGALLDAVSTGGGGGGGEEEGDQLLRRIRERFNKCACSPSTLCSVLQGLAPLPGGASLCRRGASCLAARAPGHTTATSRTPSGPPPLLCRVGIPISDVTVRFKNLTITGVVEVKTHRSPRLTDQLKLAYKVGTQGAGMQSLPCRHGARMS